MTKPQKRAKPVNQPVTDKTSAARQAKRRALFNQMRETLRDIAVARTLEEAKRLAGDALREHDIAPTSYVTESDVVRVLNKILRSE